MSKKNALQPNRKAAFNKIDENGRHFVNISIKNFRCFKDFSIESLERINLIGGKNNVGKTAFLEALFLLLGATNISLILKINSFRGIDIFEGSATSIQETLWSHLFYNFNDQTNIVISGKSEFGDKFVSVTLKKSEKTSTTIPFSNSVNDNILAGNTGITVQGLKLLYRDLAGKSHSVELYIDSQGIHVPKSLIKPSFPGIFLSARHRPNSQENAARYSQMEIMDSHYDLLPILQIIDPRLKRLSTNVVGNTSMLYGDIGLGRMLPLATMGDGLGSLVSLLLAIFSAPDGIVLIDEFENGLHSSTLVKVWQAIAEAARVNNTQIFATTHSWECINAAHEAFQSSEKYDFRFHRLQQVNDTFEAVTYDQNALQTTIESGWEMR